MGVKIAEKALLPVMVCYDGFITSHSIENIELLETDKVKEFVGEYNPENYLLDDNKNISMGPLDVQTHYFKHRKAISDDMDKVPNIIKEVSKDYFNLTGKKYDLFESYKLDDSDIAIVVLNSTAGTTKVVIDELREKGIKAGLLKPRCFRPLPFNEIADSLKHLKVVAILDKADSINGYCGPLYSEITSAMYTSNLKVKVINYIYGLGGFDVTTEHIKEVFTTLEEIKTNDSYNYNTKNYLGLEV